TYERECTFAFEFAGRRHEQATRENQATGHHPRNSIQVGNKGQWLTCASRRKLERATTALQPRNSKRRGGLE
ncbi:hypothetical protein K0M31_007433, partial [Melipona bicolor]